MFDTICNLPLSSDLIALATHPTAPIFAVGLASGHVQCFQLPALRIDSESTPSNKSHPTSRPKTQPKSTPNQRSQASKPTLTRSRDNRQPRRSSLTHSRTSTSPSPANGTSQLQTLWRTRRHRGSTRALAFSTDGSTLFSAGTDGLLKAADALTGRVVAKVAVPPPGGRGRQATSPNALLSLSPTHLILGDDAGAVLVYFLSRRKRAPKDGKGELFSALAPSESPVKHLHPHRTPDDPDASEPVTSLTALPPSASSSSGTCRAWVSTAGGTLAVGDVHKGVVSTSVEQGGKLGEELLSSVCCDGEQVTVLAGDSNGLLGVWTREEGFQDRGNAVRVHKPLPSIGPWDDDAGVECLAVRSHTTVGEGNGAKGQLVAAGLGNGMVRFLRLVDPASGARAGKGKAGKVGKSVKLLEDRINHDDRALDGVSVIAFDIEGRLLTGGGCVVKVWHPAVGTADRGEDDAEPDSEEKGEDDDSDEDDNSSIDEAFVKKPAMNGKAKAQSSDGDIDGDQDEDSDESSDDEQDQRKRKKRRRDRTSGKAKRGKRDGGGSHGILGFQGL